MTSPISTKTFKSVRKQSNFSLGKKKTCLVFVLDSQQVEHRYDCVKRLVEQRRNNARGFLVAGDLNEKNFAKKWQEKVSRVRFERFEIFSFLSARSNRSSYYSHIRTSTNIKSQCSSFTSENILIKKSID